MKKTDGLKDFNRYLMNTYAPFGAVFVKGEGPWLYDADGARYLDFCSGIAVNNLGHCHPRVVEAICTQAAELMHISNLYLHRGELELARRLTKLAFPGKLFLCQSGAEANETAIKLARKYARTVLKEDRYEIITAVGSFHGRTLGAVAATGQEKYKAGFEPLPAGFKHIAYNDLDAAAEAISDRTCAFIMEPLQGEGGVIIPDDGYLVQLQRLCASKKILLVLDEVQTGYGRTGSLFAYQQLKMTPDVITMAKSMGGGLPLGGVLAKPEAAAAFAPGNHATTFGGNPVACAAALAVLDIFEETDILANVRAMGETLMAELRYLKTAFPAMVADVRGRGLLIGMELAAGAREVMNACQEEGLLLSVVQEKVLRFTPPLIVGEEEISEAVEILKRVLSRFN